MIRCLEKNYWEDSECALNAVATAVILTFDHVSPPVSPFISFSPLSLRHGVVVVCFEEIKVGRHAIRLAPCDLGDPGWGIPGFRMVLCCFSHLCGLVCVCFPLFSLFVFLAVLAILGCDDTKLPSLHESTNELSASHACVLGLACFVCCLVLCFVWFVLCVFAVCLVYDDDGPMNYVQVLPQFSFAASTVDGLEH